MSGVAEYPGFIKSMFVNTNQSLQNGQSTLYGVTLYPLGMPHTVFVDDYLPVYMARHEVIDFKDPLDKDGKKYVPNQEDPNNKG